MVSLKASLLLVVCLGVAARAASPPESPAPAALLDTALQQEETQVFPQPPGHLSDSLQQRAAPQIPIYGDSEVDLEGEGPGFAAQGGVARQYSSADAAAEQSRFQEQPFRQGSFSQARRYGQTSVRLEALQSQRERQNQAAASLQTQRSQSRYSGSFPASSFQDEDSRDSGEGVRPSPQGSSVSRGSQKYKAADGDLESMRIAKQEMGSYHYSYDIHSEDTGDMKYHKESRDGDRVTGEYRVREPDGSMRIVRYTADKDNGFQATVEYMPNESKEEPEFGMKMSAKHSRTQQPRVRIQNRRPLVGPPDSQPDGFNSNFRGSDSSLQVQGEALEGRYSGVNNGGEIGVPSAERDLSVFVSSQDSQLDSSQQEFQSQNTGYSDIAQASQQQYLTGQENEQNQRQVQLQSQLQTRFRNHFKGSKDSSLQNESRIQENAHAGEQFQQVSENQSHSLNQNQLQTQVATGFQNQEIRDFQNQDVRNFQNQEVRGYQNQEVGGFQNQEVRGFQNQEVRGFQNQHTNQYLNKYRNRFQHQETDSFRKNAPLERHQTSGLQTQKFSQSQNQDSTNFQNQDTAQFENQDSITFQNQDSVQFQNQDSTQFQNQDATEFQNQDSSQSQTQGFTQFRNKQSSQFQNQDSIQFLNQGSAAFQNTKSTQLSNPDSTQFPNQGSGQFLSQDSKQFQNEDSTEFHNQNINPFEDQEYNQFQNQQSTRFQNQDSSQFQNQESTQFQTQGSPHFQNQESTQFQNQESPQIQNQGSSRFQNQDSIQFENRESAQFQNQGSHPFQNQGGRNFQNQGSTKFQNQNFGQFQNQGSDNFRNQDSNQFQEQESALFRDQDSNQFQKQESAQFQNQDSTEFETGNNNQIQMQNGHQLTGVFQERETLQNQGVGQFQNQDTNQPPNQNQNPNQFQDQRADGFQSEDSNQFQNQDTVPFQNQGRVRIQSPSTRRFPVHGIRRFPFRYRNRFNQQPTNSFQAQKNRPQLQERDQLDEDHLSGKISDSSASWDNEQYSNEAESQSQETNSQSPRYNRRQFAISLRNRFFNQNGDSPSDISLRGENTQEQGDSIQPQLRNVVRPRIRFGAQKENLGQRQRQFQINQLDSQDNSQSQAQFGTGQPYSENRFESLNNDQLLEQETDQAPEGYFQQFQQQLQTQRRSRFGNQGNSDESTNQDVEQFDDQLQHRINSQRKTLRKRIFNRPYFSRDSTRQRVWTNSPTENINQFGRPRFAPSRPNNQRVPEGLPSSLAAREDSVQLQNFREDPVPFSQRNIRYGGIAGRVPRPGKQSRQNAPDDLTLATETQQESNYQEASQYIASQRNDETPGQFHDTESDSQAASPLAPGFSFSNQQTQAPFESRDSADRLEGHRPEGHSPAQQIKGSLQLYQTQSERPFIPSGPASSQQGSAGHDSQTPRIPGFVRPSSQQA